MTIDGNTFGLVFYHSEIRLNRASLGLVFVFGIEMCSVYTGKSTKISYFRTFFNVWFKQDSGLFNVWLTGFTVIL